jgi:hypothetical protein
LLGRASAVLLFLVRALTTNGPRPDTFAARAIAVAPSSVKRGGRSLTCLRNTAKDWARH